MTENHDLLHKAEDSSQALEAELESLVQDFNLKVQAAGKRHGLSLTTSVDILLESESQGDING